MFTNPLNRKYQTGGPISDEDKNRIAKFITWLKRNKKQFKDKSANEIAQTILNMAKTEKGSKSLKEWREEYETSKDSIEDTSSKSMFAKKGGKMHQFICKHGRGGVNCGCSGGKNVLRGQEGFQTPDNNPYAGWTVNPRQWVTNPDGSTEAIQIIVSPDGKTGVQRRIIDRSRVKNRGTAAVRDTLYGGGAHDNGKVYIDASQNLLPQEKEAVNAILDGKVQSKQQGGKNLWDTVNGWFDNSDTEKRNADFTTNAKNAFAKGKIIEVLPNGWRREIDREWPFMGAQPENIDTALYAPNGKRIYSPTAIEMLEKIKNPTSSEDSVDKEQDGGDLSRRQVRADTRRVRKLMGNKNGHTAWEQYADMLQRTKDYEQFAGMSRLERKNALNKIILGGYTDPASVTDVEPSEAPDYVSSRKYNTGQYNTNESASPSNPAASSTPTSTPTSTATSSTMNSNSGVRKTASYTQPSATTTNYNTEPTYSTNNTATQSDLERAWLEQRLSQSSTPEEVERYSATNPYSTSGVNTGLMWRNFGRYPITGPTWGRGGIYIPNNRGTYTKPNYSWTGQLLPEDASYWRAFKQGGILNSESKKKR